MTLQLAVANVLAAIARERRYLTPLQRVEFLRAVIAKCQAELAHPAGEREPQRYRFGGNEKTGLSSRGWLVRFPQ